MEEKMRLSDEGLKFIKEQEGVVYKVYDDQAGVLTAGCGHKLTWQERRSYKLGQAVAEVQVDHWLRDDVRRAENCVRNWVITELSQTGFDALVSFAYNVGCETFKRSTVLKMINRGLMVDASHELNKYVFSKGKKLQGLVARRAEEARMFREAEAAEVA